MLDQMPAVPAVLFDFGFDQDANFTALYRAYHKAVREGLVTPQEFDDAVGNGPKLTAIAQRADKSVTVTTPYDSIKDDERPWHDSEQFVTDVIMLCDFLTDVMQCNTLSPNNPIDHDNDETVGEVVARIKRALDRG